MLTRNPEWKRAKETHISMMCLNKDFSSEDDEAFGKLFGLSNTGALLIRPDGYIAWRTTEFDMKAFAEALQTILSGS